MNINQAHTTGLSSKCVYGAEQILITREQEHRKSASGVPEAVSLKCVLFVCTGTSTCFGLLNHMYATESDPTWLNIVWSMQMEQRAPKGDEIFRRDFCLHIPA